MDRFEANTALTIFLYLLCLHQTPIFDCRPSENSPGVLLTQNGNGNGRLSPSSIYEPSLAAKKLCRLPSEAGPCSKSIKRFYYSAHSRHCVEFVYSGCNGNQNNFDNITECEETCRGVSPCPYSAWVPGCTLKQNGEDSDGCQTYEMSCEPIPSDKEKTVSTTAVAISVRASTTGPSVIVATTETISMAQFSKLRKDAATSTDELSLRRENGTAELTFNNETLSSRSSS